jgi:hypothetical protein
MRIAVAALSLAAVCTVSQSANAQNPSINDKDHVPNRADFQMVLEGSNVGIETLFSFFSAPATSIFTLSPVPMGVGGYWEEIGGGISLGQSNSTGNFFGPGTGNGLLLENNNWSGSFVVSGGLYRGFGPWYGGVNLKLLVPPFNTATQNGITSNGIPVSSQVQQSGLGVDAMGRIGLFNPFGLQNPIGVYIGGGVEVAPYTGTILAPSVGDSFNQSKTITSPIIEGGFDFNMCPLFIQPTSPGVCPHLQLDVSHTFNNSSWLLQTTPLSSGLASVMGTTRFSAEVVIPFAISGRGP